MAVREFTVLVPRSAARTDAQLTDSIQHVNSRFGTTLADLAAIGTESGLRSHAGTLSGTETGVKNALASLAELELKLFLS